MVWMGMCCVVGSEDDETFIGASSDLSGPSNHQGDAVLSEREAYV
jgi:hypothetical protein